jgi:hypothetical protein
MGKIETWRNELFYFGCYGRSGHYLHVPSMEHAYGLMAHKYLEYLDGDLAPEGGQVQFKAQLWRLTGYTPTPYSALSWWDRSVDKRPGSNSILFAPGHTVTAQGILDLAHRLYPKVMGRLPPIEILPGEHSKVRVALAQQGD